MYKNDNHIYQNSKPIRIALVYPPYGPVAIPNLGLAILSSSVKERGYECKTFFWNFDFLECLPASGKSAIELYHALSSRSMHPWNEWPFARWVFPNKLSTFDQNARRHLKLLSESSYFQHWSKSPQEIVNYIQAQIPKSIDRMVSKLNGFDLVGICSTYYQQLPSLALSKHLKSTSPDIFIIIGGANCDGGMGKAHMEFFPWVDAIIEGEADTGFSKLVDAFSNRNFDEFKNIPGLIWRNEKGVFSGRCSIPTQNLDLIPTPDYDDYLVEFKKRLISLNRPLCLPLETSRGCWWGAKHHCKFCGLNALGMPYREKSFSRFVDETININHRYGNKLFFMADNILSTSYYKRLSKLRSYSNPEFNFFFEIKSNAKRNDVRRLSNGGVSYVQPGIESFSTNLLRLMNKGVSAIQNVAFLKYSREYGVIPVYNILYGFPGEEAKDYIDMLKQLPAIEHLYPPASCAEIEIQRFSPYHSDPVRYGLKLKPLDTYKYLYPLQEKDIEKIAYVFRRSNCLKTNQLPYLNQLLKVILDWQHAFDKDNIKLRIMSESETCIKITENRSKFGCGNYLLHDFAASLIKTLDQPRSLRDLIVSMREQSEYCVDEQGIDLNVLQSDLTYRKFSEIGSDIELIQNSTPASLLHSLSKQAEVLSKPLVQTIRFTTKEFIVDPCFCIKQLLERGLIYLDGDQAVALAVKKDTRPSVSEWFQLQL
ncbi:MAG: RiPP maturation radical SAM C-methyltransferase [Candidatus Thiodiazotropha taylori]